MSMTMRSNVINSSSCIYQYQPNLAHGISSALASRTSCSVPRLVQSHCTVRPPSGYMHILNGKHIWFGHTALMLDVACSCIFALWRRDACPRTLFLYRWNYYIFQTMLNVIVLSRNFIFTFVEDGPCSHDLLVSLQHRTHLRIMLPKQAHRLICFHGFSHSIILATLIYNAIRVQRIMASYHGHGYRPSTADCAVF
jgi:hypothetical protein